MKLILSLLNVGLEIYWKFLSNLYFYRYFKTNLNFSRHWLIWKSKSISISLLIDYLNPIRLLSCVGQVKLQSSMVRSDQNSARLSALASVSTSRGRSWVVSVSKIVHILVLVSVSTISSFPVSVSKLRLTSESLSLGLESWDWLSKISVSKTETLI